MRREVFIAFCSSLLCSYLRKICSLFLRLSYVYLYAYASLAIEILFGVYVCSNVVARSVKEGSCVIETWNL